MGEVPGSGDDHITRIFVAVGCEAWTKPGAPGPPESVRVEVAVGVYEPVNITFAAATRNSYDVFEAKPVTTTEVADESSRANGTHVFEPVTRYCTA
jgi:hypothetical protein